MRHVCERIILNDRCKTIFVGCFNKNKAQLFSDAWVCGLWGNQWFIGWFGFNNGARCLIGTRRRHLGWEIGVQVKEIVEELLTCRQRTQMSIDGPEPVSRSCEGKAQSDMKIERACLPYVPAKVLCEFCFCCCACAVGWLSQLNYQAVCIVCELITGIHCALFCSEGFFFSRKLGRWKQNP